MERLPDGRLLMAFRDWSGSPHGQLAITVSTDDGHHWSAPAAMQAAKGSVDPHAVEPKLFLLPNGVLGALPACVCEKKHCMARCTHSKFSIVCCATLTGDFFCLQTPSSAELRPAGDLPLDA